MTIVIKEKGYSLVEMLVSMIIFLILTLGVMEMMRFYISRELGATLRNEAHRLASSCLEDLRWQNYCFNITNCDNGTCEGNYTYHIKNLTKTFEINFTDPGSITNTTEAFVRVIYTHRGLSHQVEMKSLIKPYE